MLLFMFDNHQLFFQSLVIDYQNRPAAKWPELCLVGQLYSLTHRGRCYTCTVGIGRVSLPRRVS